MSYEEEQKERIEILEMHFKFIEELLTSREFKNKEDVMAEAQKFYAKCQKNGTKKEKLASAQMLSKIDKLTFEEIQSIVAVLKVDPA